MKPISLFVLLASTAIAIPTPAIAQSAQELFCRGVYQQRQWQSGEAIASFSQAIKKNPRHANAYFYRGAIHQHLKRWPEAEANYQQALKLGFTEPHLIFWNVGIINGELGDYKGALRELSESIKLNPFPSASDYEVRGLAYFKLGNRQAAIADLQKASQIYYRSGQQSNYLETLEHIKKIRNGGKAYPRNWSMTIGFSELEKGCP